MKVIITASLFVLCFATYTHDFMTYNEFVEQIMAENELSLDVNDPNIKFILEKFYKVSFRLSANTYWDGYRTAKLQSQVDELKSDYDRDIESIKKPYEKLLVENEAIYDLYNRIKKENINLNKVSHDVSFNYLTSRLVIFHPVKMTLGCVTALVSLGYTAKKGFDYCKQYYAKRKQKQTTATTKETHEINNNAKKKWSASITCTVQECIEKRKNKWNTWQCPHGVEKGI